MARQKGVTPATVFSATVRSALEHYADPVWLGRQSPLATPYFLGHEPEGQPASGGVRERGLALQDAIRAAATEMWGGPLPATRQALSAAVDEERNAQGNKSSRYRYFLLDLRYFRRHFPPNAFPTAVEAIPGYVNVSPTRFFIHLEEAIDDLGRRLLDRLNPALRLERPALAMPPIGRAGTVEAVRLELLAGRSVAVSGTGGVGKTTVGAALIAEWPGDAIFWYTFRPGLNDDLNSLLFNLGHFVRAAGAPTLWAQLLAGEGKSAPPAQALGMLRMDLEAIAARRPLLCFDEMDLLQTSAGEPRRKQHAQVLELLESLRGIAPLLLIGQRVYVDTDVHFALEPLPPAGTVELLGNLGVMLDAPALQQVQQFTRGNPRLLELYAALRRGGDDEVDALQMAHDPSAQPLFSRLWRRLDEDERSQLSALSVFRSYAPRDAWADSNAALSSLIARNLIKTDLAGGVALLPFVRDLVYDTLPDERRHRYHQDAAFIRAQHGDYTAAAHHYCEAGEPAAAVQVWYAHQDQEILAGQATAAGEVFSHLDPRTLDISRRNELHVIQNRLALLAGESERVLEGMETFSWDGDDPTAAEAIAQWANALELRDQTDQALTKYEQAIDMLSRATTQTVGWHLRRGYVYLHEANPQAGQREAQLAMCDLERMLGTIDYVSGRLEAAKTHFLASLQIAETVADAGRIARAHYNLSMIAGRQGRIDDARDHAEKAMAHYAEVGDRLQLEGMRAELAGMYLNVQQFEAVIEPAERALQFFERIKHDVWVSHISSNLAEAYMETGRLDKAKEYAFRVLRMELPPSRPYALYTLGHIHSREGNPAHAETSFSEGISIARMNEDPFIEAYLQRALGALYRDNGRPEESKTCFVRALELFNRMGLQQEVEETDLAMGLRSEASPSN